MNLPASVSVFRQVYTEKGLQTDEGGSSLSEVFWEHKILILLLVQMFYSLHIICASEHFSLAKIIHPRDRCDISVCWIHSLINAQVCLGLVTIKGHSKMCDFVAQHIVKDVATIEGVDNWHGDFKNIGSAASHELNVHFTTISHLKWQHCFENSMQDHRSISLHWWAFSCWHSLLLCSCETWPFHSNLSNTPRNFSIWKKTLYCIITRLRKDLSVKFNLF